MSEYIDLAAEAAARVYDAVVARDPYLTERPRGPQSAEIPGDVYADLPEGMLLQAYTRPEIDCDPESVYTLPDGTS